MYKPLITSKCDCGAIALQPPYLVEYPQIIANLHTYRIIISRITQSPLCGYQGPLYRRYLIYLSSDR